MIYKRHGASIYKTERWKAVRLMAKRRDGWKCVSCGIKGVRLEVDHIKALRNGGAPYDLNNLQSLCARCHTKKTRIECGHPEKTPERKAWDALLRAGLPDFNKT
jgi:5-methylcytosine-specific restriction enzyme A